MADEKTKELKRYTRELLRDHQALEQSLREAEAIAERRAEEVTRLQEEAKALEEKSSSSSSLGGAGPELFGELVRQKDRAYAAEVEARKLKVMLAMANDLRTVDVARTKAASSRALVAAMANLRRRQQRALMVHRKNTGDYSFDDDDDDLLEDDDDLLDDDVVRRRLREDEALARREREALVEAVETACVEVAEQFKRKPRPLHNSDGVARRLVVSLERASSHRASKIKKFEPYAGFLLQSAAAAARLGLPKKAEDAVLVCVAKAKEAKIPRWMKRIGWGVGRSALLELLNRGVAHVAFRAITVETVGQQPLKSKEGLEYDDLNQKKGPDDDASFFFSLSKDHFSLAGPAVATFRDGAVFLDVECSRRIIRALYELEVVRRVLFAYSHLNDKSKRFLDDDKRSLGLQSTTNSAFKAFFEGAVNFVACGATADSDQAPGGGGGGRVFSQDDDDDDDFFFDQGQMMVEDGGADEKMPPPSSRSYFPGGGGLAAASSDDDDAGRGAAQKVNMYDVAPGPTMLAALRRRGAKSAATKALDLTPWRKATIEPPRLWSRKRGALERRIKLREGPVPHVVCYQWQSLSQKLKWSLVFERGASAAFFEHQNRTSNNRNNESSPTRGARSRRPPTTTIPETDVVDREAYDDHEANLSSSSLRRRRRENSDDSLGAEADDDDYRRRWGGDLAVPDDDDSDNASVAIASAASVALANASLAFKAPETWSPAELVPGADKTLGPVRESWCLVPPGARVSLRCEVVAGRPLVRARHARFRLAASRADDFFGDGGHLKDVARIADDVGWHVAKDVAAFPPADAADFCAKKQLIQGPPAKDLLDALVRVDAINNATTTHQRPTDYYDAAGPSAFLY